ncbi:DUF4232 domain-containing protein [Brachybacterium epidermidis]|uniref:DUF4232 domain-containing protein n=1 Tax=Brachybacterium epidermidis TaxID=2781983 RepID=UPI00398EC32B
MSARIAAVGVTLVLAALAVMTAVGIHASQLGDDPAWLFDCNDTTCVDLWADARSHYLRVSASAVAAGLLGWALIGAARPADGSDWSPQPWAKAWRPTQSDERRFGAPGWATVVIAIGPILAVRTGWTALLISTPLAIALLCGLGALMSIVVWLGLRERTGQDRLAWFGATAVVLAGGAVGALTTAALFPLIFLWAPGAAILVAIAVMILARHGIQRWLSDKDGTPIPTDPEAQATAWVTGPVGTVFTIGTVLLITAVAVMAAWPVDAPAKDAWMYGTAGGQAATPSAEAKDPAAQQPSSTSQDARSAPSPEPEAAPGPAIVPAEILDCRPDQLELSIGGWDSATGDSWAVLKAQGTAEEPCALRGRPELVITQGGDRIDLRHEPLAEDSHLQDPALGVVLEPGSTARAQLYWPGYRTAADKETPQSATVILTDGTDPIRATLEQADGDVVVPAPFDLKDGVEGGAEIQVGVWSTGA